MRGVSGARPGSTVVRGSPVRWFGVDARRSGVEVQLQVLRREAVELLLRVEPRAPLGEFLREKSYPQLRLLYRALAPVLSPVFVVVKSFAVVPPRLRLRSWA